MSGLLQRLAGQALGAGAATTARVRAAASVHAQPPVVLPATENMRRPGPQPAAPVVESAGPDNFHIAPRPEREAARSESVATRVVPLAPGAAHSGSVEMPVSAGAEAPAAPVPPLTESPPRDAPTRPPERLLGEVAPAAAAANILGIMPVHTPPLVASQAFNAEREPVVHVHIGRIEVTAVHEAGAPSKPRAAPRATRPLSDYLVQRTRS